VVLARRRRGLEPDEQLDPRMHPDRPVYTGTMAEVAGVRPNGGTGGRGSEAERQTAPIGAQAEVGAATSHREGGW
jgi:hypothetical protein